MNVCGMPASLLASMLFGHVRGAFTGADQPHEGFLARARGGTLLLDEIGDLPVEMQPSLLRMLELGVYTPLGSTQEVPVLARLVCATNADLVAKVDRREFRADLFWRLNVLRVHVPALAERRADIPELVRHFAAQEGVSFSEEAIQWLVLQPHPGNVRGLKNTVIRAAVSALTPVIQLADVQRMEGSAVAGPRRLRDQILAVERERVEAAFRASGGNLTKAGLLLGEDRRWVARRLRSAKMVRNGE